MVVRADGDFYDLLGVPRTADKKTIKQAYRQKARKYHPVRGATGRERRSAGCTRPRLPRAELVGCGC